METIWNLAFARAFLGPRFQSKLEATMKGLASAFLVGALVAFAVPVMAAQSSNHFLTQVPSDGISISDYYNQSVYDNRDNKIGDVKDLVVEKGGKINAAILGVGGFLGVGEKNVAVPFDELKLQDKNGKRYLVVDTNKDALNNAPGYTWDRDKRAWLPEREHKKS
jgi:sporulation protein YlmC with PRC-barrel domain